MTNESRKAFCSELANAVVLSIVDPSEAREKEAREWREKFFLLLETSVGYATELTESLDHWREALEMIIIDADGNAQKERVASWRDFFRDWLFRATT